MNANHPHAIIEFAILEALTRHDGATSLWISARAHLDLSEIKLGLRRLKHRGAVVCDGSCWAATP
jgi:hypothetical protein